MSGQAKGESSDEPTLKVDTREELVYLLGQACEIEHGLMCEYLYAQFSLKRGPDEGLTEAQLARVQAWEATLIAVIKQEMLHLALATNILTAIGAAPHFERPDFPILSRWYPEGVQIALVPFGERALRHFIYLERPEGMALDDAAGFAAARHAQPLTVGGVGLVAEPEEWRTVGHLYRGIEAGLAHLCDRHGEDEVFIGPARAQAVTDIFEWPELIAVTDLASARRAIETIVEQGEGARGDWVRSHFGTFVGILEDLLAVQASDPAFVPARPVEPAFAQLPPDVKAGTLIEDPATAQVADLADGLYETVLQVLSRYYIHHGETAAEFDSGSHRQAPDELGDARAWAGADRAAGGPVPPRPHRRPDLQHRASRRLLAAAPGRGLEDHQGTARYAAASLRFPRPANGPRRARPPGRQAPLDEPGHRDTYPPNHDPAAAPRPTGWSR
jgi:Ferritin-like